MTISDIANFEKGDIPLNLERPTSSQVSKIETPNCWMFFNDFDQFLTGYQQENFIIQIISKNEKSNMRMLTKISAEN